MGTLRYRVRLRNLDDTDDLWLATSVRGGTHPYIKRAPRSDGQEVDPVTGRVTQGQTVIEIIDWWGEFCLVTTGPVLDQTVESVTVSPTSLTIQEGSTGTLSATVKNADGQVLTGKVVTWASDDPSVTLGPDNGDEAHQVVATGASVGSANITATCETVDSSPAVVTVEEVVTGTLYFADKFDTGNKSHTSGGWAWQPGNPTVQSIPAALPGGLATTYALRHRHTTFNGNQEQRFRHGVNLTGYFFGFYIYIPPNYCHRDGPSSDNNKFWRAWSGNKADGNEGYSQYHVAAGFSTDVMSVPNCGSRMRSEYGVSNASCGQAGMGQHSTPHSGLIFPANAGAWFKIRGEQRVSSSVGASDGRIRLWVNDVIKCDFTNLPLYSSCPTGTNYFDRGYVEGAANSGWNEQTDIYTTRFRIASTYALADPDLTTGW